VYATDIAAAGSRVAGVEIPDSLNVVADYPITVLKDSHNAPLAEAFVGYVLDADGQRILARDGFLGP